MRRLGVALAALALGLAGCATAPTPVVVPSPAATASPPPELTPPDAGSGLQSLAGWPQEDHLAAFGAFRAGCGAARDPALVEVCRRARSGPPRDRSAARRFFEANFRFEPIGETGLLTAYFAPRYEGRMARTAEFSAPVRGRPADLVIVDLAAFDPALAGKRIVGRFEAGKFVPYPDRAAIEAAPTDTPLAWMRPEELFFLQIQGSGVLVLPDGRQVRAAYAASNGRRYVGIATAMRDRGLLADNDTSGEAIRAWLAAHRGPEADAIMALNPSYVFFALSPDDGAEPVGSAGVSLPAGRAIAVDPSLHAMGGVYWLDASAPRLAGAFPTYRRLVLALDVGGAIKGLVRADLYIGSGPAAGTEAGRVRHDLRLYRLIPQPGS